MKNNPLIRTVSVVVHESAQEAWVKLTDTDIDQRTGKLRLREYAVTDSGKVLVGLEIKQTKCRYEIVGYFDRRVTLEDFCSAVFAAFSELVRGA